MKPRDKPSDIVALITKEVTDDSFVLDFQVVQRTLSLSFKAAGTTSRSTTLRGHIPTRMPCVHFLTGCMCSGNIFVSTGCNDT